MVDADYISRANRCTDFCPQQVQRCVEAGMKKIDAHLASRYVDTTFKPNYVTIKKDTGLFEQKNQSQRDSV